MVRTHTTERVVLSSNTVFDNRTIDVNIGSTRQLSRPRHCHTGRCPCACAPRGIETPEPLAGRGRAPHVCASCGQRSQLRLSAREAQWDTLRSLTARVCEGAVPSGLARLAHSHLRIGRVPACAEASIVSRHRSEVARIFSSCMGLDTCQQWSNTCSLPPAPTVNVARRPAGVGQVCTEQPTWGSAQGAVLRECACRAMPTFATAAAVPSAAAPESSPPHSLPALQLYIIS